MRTEQNTPEDRDASQWSRYLAIGRRVAARYPDACTAYISGSILDGFGTPRSDLDIFVLTASGAAAPDSESESESAGTPVATLHADGYVIELDYAEDIPTDTEIWSIDVVSGLPAEFAKIDIDDWTAAGAVPDAKLNLAHRVRIGEPVAGHQVFRELQAGFDWQRLALVLRNRCLAAYNNLADDAIGAVEANDPMSAVLASRQALGAAVDALTAARGHTNPKEKWRWRKLRSLELDEVATSYRTAELDPLPDDASLLAQSKARLRLAADLVLRATLDPPLT